MEIRIRATGAVMLEDEFRRWVKETDGATFDAVTADILERFGADPVFEGPQATGGTVYQVSTRQGVEQVEGKWYTKYVLGPVFSGAEDEAAYKTARDAAQADAVREDRNKRLADCDWTQLADAPVDKPAWASYRQALRDVPKQAGFPWNIAWPVAP